MLRFNRVSSLVFAAVIGWTISLHPASAAIVTYEISVTGGFTASGYFSFDDSAGLVIDASDLTALSLTVTSPGSVTFDLTTQVQQFDFTRLADGTPSILSAVLADYDAGIVGEPQPDGTLYWNVALALNSIAPANTALTQETAGPAGPAQGPIGGTLSVSAVPIPAALPLFATGLAIMGLLGWRRRRRAAAAA